MRINEIDIRESINEIKLQIADDEGFSVSLHATFVVFHRFLNTPNTHVKGDWHVQRTYSNRIKSIKMRLKNRRRMDSSAFAKGGV